MHFFSEPGKLIQQIPADRYGADNAAPSTPSTTKYNVTSLFELPNDGYAKAVACENGMMIVQQSAAHIDLVNVILRPWSSGKAGYYIYRNIRKASLIDTSNSNGVNIAPKSSSNSEFISLLYGENPNQNSLTSNLIGFDNNALDGGINVEEVFDGSKPLALPRIVNEGEWFGDFTKSGDVPVAVKIGFEVILEPDKIKIDLAFVRGAKTVIDIDDLPDTPVPTLFEVRAKREEILAFVDPAAFFGSFTSTGSGIAYSKYVTENSGKITKTTPRARGVDIYTILLPAFITKNRVYLDVRNEKGYSYNFYQNYKDTNNLNIKIGHSNVNPVAQAYKTSEWPIIFIDDAQTQSAVTTPPTIPVGLTSPANWNNIRINLRIDDNTRPLLFNPGDVNYIARNSTTPNIVDNRNKTKFISHGYLIPDPFEDWTKEIMLFFPNAGGNSNPKQNIANHLKLYYFRHKYNPVKPNPDTVFENERYFDSAFCPISLPGFLTSGKKSISNRVLNYVRDDSQTDGTGNFGYVATNGVHWNTERVLFYSTMLDRTRYYINRNTNNDTGIISSGTGKNERQIETNSGKEFINTYSRELSFSSRGFDTGLKRRIFTICKEYQNTAVSSNAVFKIPGINFYRTTDNKKDKENLLLLGLTKDQAISVRDFPGFSDKHHRYIFLEAAPASPYWNRDVANGDRFFEYTVKVQGMSTDGIVQILTPTHNGSPVLVYSRDNIFFSSIGFAEGETLTSLGDHIEFHIYQDNRCVKINDNIDFSLLPRPANSNIFYHRIYYKYHDTADAVHDMCDLELRQVDRLYTGYAVGAFDNVNPVAQTIAYNTPGVDAATTRIYQNGNIFTRGHDNSIQRYDSTKQKAFLVFFDQARVDNNHPHPTRIEFAFNSSTIRYYGDPKVAAAFIGALIELRNINPNQITMGTGGSGASPVGGSGGMAFDHGSCFPSKTHTNGEAVDTNYKLVFSNPTPQFPSGVLALDQIIMNTLDNWGFGFKVIGSSPTFASLTGESSSNSQHDNHLHSGGLQLNDCDL
jgi:hypothetical protein